MAGPADHYDVVVLGSGAAGLTAAVRAAAGGARVGLFEKAATVGGTSAWSGGTVWLPNSRHEAKAGFADSRQDVLKGCLDRGVLPQTECRGVRLLTGDDGVTGVLIEGADGPFEARARGGVVLATGGFEHDPKLVRTFLRGPLERAVSVPTNTGDALRMAMRAGADLATMREAWWVATIDVEVPGRGQVPWQVNSERTRPHSIMVNDDGVRFTNEAANYNALGNAFHVVDVARFAYVNHPAWLLLDHHFLAQYGLARHRPPAPTPGWLI